MTRCVRQKSPFRCRWALALFGVLQASMVGAVNTTAPWDEQDLPFAYVIDADGSDDINDGSDIAAISQAFDSWQCYPNSAIRVTYQGAATARHAGDDGSNTVYFVEEAEQWDLGPATLSASVVTVESSG